MGFSRDIRLPVTNCLGCVGMSKSAVFKFFMNHTWGFHQQSKQEKQTPGERLAKQDQGEYHTVM